MTISTLKSDFDLIWVSKSCHCVQYDPYLVYDIYRILYLYIYIYIYTQWYSNTTIDMGSNTSRLNKDNNTNIYNWIYIYTKTSSAWKLNRKKGGLQQMRIALTLWQHCAPPVIHSQVTCIQNCNQQVPVLVTRRNSITLTLDAKK